MSRKSPELLLLALLLAASPASATESPKKPATEAVKKASPAEIREWVNTGKAFFNGGFMGERDYKKAYDFFKKAADQGDAEALYMLGTLNYEGKGTRKDEKTAFALYEQAAEKGHTDSQMLTGTQHMYLAMRHAPSSEKRAEEYKKAADLFKKAADKNQTEAMLWYGDMQLKGLGGVPQDKKAGLARIEKAIELRNPNAMAVLGGYYLEGKILPLNLKKAYYYLLLSDRAGNQNARVGVRLLEEKLTENERSNIREEVKAWLRAHPAPEPEISE